MKPFAFLTSPLAWVATLPFALLAACAADTTPQQTSCAETAECITGQLCQDEICVVADCRTDAECGADLECDRGFCTAPQADVGVDTDRPDLGTDVIDEDTTPDITEDPTTDTPTDTADTSDASDTEPDVAVVPLEVVSTTPQDAQTRVPLDTNIEVVFNQAMNRIGFIPSSVQIIAPDGETVPWLIDGNASGEVLRLTPGDGSWLQSATPYAVRLDRNLQSETGQTLGDAYRFNFATIGPAGDAFRGELAAHYAPVVYQQADTNRLDTFTSIDFDGDLNPANNLAAASGSNNGYMYYAVVETRTHYLIQYMLYYPGRELNINTTGEHDTLGISVVVEKRAADRLGAFRAMTTIYQTSMQAWAADATFYDGDAPTGVEASMAASELEGDSHPSVFIESGRHNICLPSANGAGCAPASDGNGPFEDGTDGFVYRAGDVAQRDGDAADDALTYLLLPFMEKIWVLRNNTSGDTPLFNGTRPYAPPVGRPGDGAAFPTSLSSADDFANGDLPFSYEAAEVSGVGAWFADPAYAVDELVTFPEVFSTEYCFNPYLGIDERGINGECSSVDGD